MGEKVDDLVGLTAALDRALDDGDEPAAEAAIRALGVLGDVRAAGALIGVLESERDDLRMVKLRAEAASALGELGAAEAAAALGAYLASGRDCIRAAKALESLGARAVPVLVDVLETPSSEARRAAVQALGRLGDPSAVDPLQRLAGRTKHFSLLAALAEALERLGWRARRSTSRVRIVQLLLAGRAVELIEMGRQVLPTVKLALGSRNPRARKTASRVLCALGRREDVDSILKALRSRRGHAAEEAAQLLGELGDRRAIEPLIELLHRKPRPWFHDREHAAMALGRLGDPTAIPALGEVLADSRDVELRKAAAQALGMMGREDAVQKLLPHLRDADGEVRQAVSKALEASGWEPPGDDEAVAALAARKDWEGLVARGRELLWPIVRALSQGHAEVQQRLVAVLGQLGDPRAAEAVVAWLFGHPTLIESRSALARWTREMSPLFGDYAEVLLSAACLVEVHSEHWEDEYGDKGQTTFSYDLGPSERAIRELEGLQTGVATNLLHAVTKKKDVQVVSGDFWNDWGGGQNHEWLRFTAQRDIARRALQRRKSDRADPEAYLKTGAWTGK
ncbi:MAG: HEAT repeat domain-containing protein [Deltaproteobacteria bacterium]|nr:HEAT repeat domain-containing protein [Deltaproteobacteria bacterium]